MPDDATEQGGHHPGKAQGGQGQMGQEGDLQTGIGADYLQQTDHQSAQSGQAEHPVVADAAAEEGQNDQGGYTTLRMGEAMAMISLMPKLETTALNRQMRQTRTG